jgi:hypothetical protein
MKQSSPQTMTLDQLVQGFIEIGVAQDQALLEDDVSGFNRLFDLMQALVDELKMRSGDQRRLLLRLYDHPNMQVRLKAAKATLAVSPQVARDALEAIRASKWMPQALDAGMCLRALDQGIFKPT